MPGGEQARRELRHNSTRGGPVRQTMSLWELLACPVCGGDVALDAAGQRVTCGGGGCGRIYPVRDGVPIMLEDPARALTAHQGELPARPGYSRWKERIILKSLTAAQV